MFKKKNTDESIYHEERLRFVTTEFSGLGINGHEGDTFLIAANVPAPPCLLLNSEHCDAPAPFNAIRYDRAAHESYTRANMPRVEPPPAITTMLTSNKCAKSSADGANRTFASRARLGFPSRPRGRRSRRRGLFDRYRTLVGSGSGTCMARSRPSVARRQLTVCMGRRAQRCPATRLVVLAAVLGVTANANERR